MVFEIAVLEDHLHFFSGGMSQLNHGFQIGLHVIPVAAQHTADVANQIQFFSAIGKSLLSFGHFSRCAMAAVRKTNHGARTNFGAAQDIRAAFQVVRLNANAACLVDECHSTTDFKVLKCQCGLQQRMIDHARNVFVGIVHSRQPLKEI